MKKICVLVFAAFMVLMSCKQKGSSSSKTTDSTKTSNGMNLPDLGSGLKTSSGGSWSKAYKDKFISGCISKASEKIGAGQAYNYCSCMADKVEAKYPVETEVDAKLTDADVDNMKGDCITSSGASQSGTSQSGVSSDQSGTSSASPGSGSNAGWSYSDQKAFMDKCVSGASTSLGSSGASSYCECMLDKLMQAYPNAKDVGNVSKEQMSSLANDCLGKK